MARTVAPNASNMESRNGNFTTLQPDACHEVSQTKTITVRRAQWETETRLAAIAPRR